MYRSELRERVQETHRALTEGRLVDAEATSLELVRLSAGWLEVEQCAAKVARARVLLAGNHVAEAHALAAEVARVRDNDRNRRRRETQLVAAWQLLGDIAIREQRHAEGREPLRLAHEAYRHRRWHREAEAALADRLRIELAVGDHASAAVLAADVAAGAEAKGQASAAGQAWTLSGTEAVQAGRLDLAERALLRATALHAAGEPTPDALVSLAELAVVLHLSGRDGQSERCWDVAQRSVSLLPSPHDRARTSVALGQCACRMGLPTQASAMLRPVPGAALHPADDARRRRWLGEALVTTGRIDSGRVELATAHAAATALGQDALAGEALTLLTRFGGPLEPQGAPAN